MWLDNNLIRYQYGSPDRIHDPSLNIEKPYVDGVSVTYGIPRQHIWTLHGAGNPSVCRLTLTLLSFVGNSYFCDTGNPTVTNTVLILFPDSPLWDGIAECGDAICCAPHSGPWFNTILTAPTTDNIEIRICANEDTDNESNEPLKLVEIRN